MTRRIVGVLLSDRAQQRIVKIVLLILLAVFADILLNTVDPAVLQKIVIWF